jgi:hypothetical protein
MGIALLALSGLFQGFASSKRATLRAAKPLRTISPASCTRFADTVPTLRVLRVTENDQRVCGAGRMVISGRMADVCAELDRLAALEAAQSQG